MITHDQSALLASVVHELRAPLNACLMAVSLLELKAEEPDAVRGAAEVIRRNIDRQALLIREFAETVQVVSGDIALRRERIPVEALVDGAVASVEAAAAERGLALARGPVPDRAVETDAERAAQVLEVLLGNLFAGTERGARIALDVLEEGPCVRISAAVVGEGTGTAAEAGRANAPGMAAGRRQGQQPTATGRPIREQKGFALQLLLAESLTGRLGGTIERDAGGFSLRLPLAAPE